jgi:uncharacterized protein (DUF427 family)
MKIPGPDHPITVTPAARRWRGKFQGHVIADSANALVLQESTYPQVIYFPREDVSMEYLSRTAHTTNCPYKGDASYYTLLMDGHFAENAVWTYETPYPAMTQIANYVAFYPNHVELYEVDDAAVNPHHIDEDIDQIVQHTDSGSGAPQGEHWPANVNTPGVEGGVR